VDPEDREHLLRAAARLIRAEHEGELRGLVEAYCTQRDRERMAPKRKAVRDELGRIEAAYCAAAQAVDDASPQAVELWLGDAALHGAELERVDGLARRAEAGLRWLGELRPRGGAGTIAHLLGPGARFTLCRRLAHILERQQPEAISSTVHGQLYQAAFKLLTAAGEPTPERGLADVVADAVRAHRADRVNRRPNPPDRPLSRVA
jgi:hypothetical protein